MIRMGPFAVGTSSMRKMHPRDDDNHCKFRPDEIERLAFSLQWRKLRLTSHHVRPPMWPHEAPSPVCVERNTPLDVHIGDVTQRLHELYAHSHGPQSCCDYPAPKGPTAEVSAR